MRPPLPLVVVAGGGGRGFGNREGSEWLTVVAPARTESSFDRAPPLAGFFPMEFCE